MCLLVRVATAIAAAGGTDVAAAGSRCGSLKVSLSAVGALWAECRIYVTHQRAHNGVVITRELTERDVHGALSVVAEAAAPNAGGPFGLPVLERLSELIGVDQRWRTSSTTWTRRRGAPRLWSTRSSCTQLRLRSPVVHFNPLREESVGDAEIPLTLSDFLTPRARRRNPFVQEVLRPVGIEHELKIFLPAASRHNLRVRFHTRPRP